MFYLELSIDDTEFLQIKEFEKVDTFDPDELLEQHQSSAPTPSPQAEPESGGNDDLLDELGI